MKLQGVNSEALQFLNRTMVLKTLYQTDVCSRAYLAKSTGLKNATITNIISDLIEFDVVEETGVITGAMGRRSIGLRIKSERFKIAAVRIHKRYVRISVRDISQKQYFDKMVPCSPLHDLKGAVDIIVHELQKATALFDGDTFIGIGVAVAGPMIKVPNGFKIITDSGDWQEAHIQDTLEKLFAVPVIIEQTANAGAMWEWHLSKHRYTEGSLFYIAGGYGIGSGFVINGTIYSGAHGMAGELSHMTIDRYGEPCFCGKRGCLETISSIQAILKKLAVHYPSIDVKQMTDLYKGGDARTVQIVDETAEGLSLAISNIIFMYNPNEIVIGDDMASLGEPFLRHLLENIDCSIFRELMKTTEIRLSNEKGDPVIAGITQIVTDAFLDNPSCFNREEDNKEE